MDKENLTFSIEDLAAALRRAVPTVRNQMYREPERLPPWVSDSQPRIWHVPTVSAWLQAKSAPVTAPVRTLAEQPVRRGRGRPRKTPRYEGSRGPV